MLFATSVCMQCYILHVAFKKCPVNPSIRINKSGEYCTGVWNALYVKIVDSDDPEKECVFPFTHDNVTYYGCPVDPIDETKRWCSTKTDENGLHIANKGAWGYCTSDCKAAIGILNSAEGNIQFLR